MRQVTSELQTSGSNNVSMIYNIVPGAVCRKPVWNISVNVNVFLLPDYFAFGRQELRKNDDFRSPGVPFLSNFASQMCPGASMWPRGGPKSENGWILSSLLAPWGTMFE